MLPSPSLNLIPVHISHPSVKLIRPRPPASGGPFFHAIVRLGRFKDNWKLPIVAIWSPKRRAANRLNLQKNPPPWTKNRWGQMLQLHVAPPEASATVRVGYSLSPAHALDIPLLSAGRTLPSCARLRFECRKACGRSIRAAAHRRSSGCEAALECVSIFSRSRPCDHDSSPRETTERKTSMPLAFAFARYTVDFRMP